LKVTNFKILMQQSKFVSINISTLINSKATILQYVNDTMGNITNIQSIYT